jgi:hypothetical protein
MYNSIVSSIKKKVDTNTDIDLVIPVGTAIQNARTSTIGDTLTRDGFHMSYDLGRYLTGLMFFKQLTNIEIDNIDYCPETISEEVKQICIKAVNAAYKNPYEITNLK